MPRGNHLFPRGNRPMLRGNCLFPRSKLRLPKSIYPFRHSKLWLSDGLPARLPCLPGCPAITGYRGQVRR
ncbi:MAG: hypothetical protein LBF62_12215 [Tannerellaceae bacterium]|nr:hypothetical protein [Tannerellaceae bacterium]